MSNPTKVKTALERLVDLMAKPTPLTREQAEVLATVKFPCC